MLSLREQIQKAIYFMTLSIWKSGELLHGHSGKDRTGGMKIDQWFPGVGAEVKG